ncbi:MAG: hypothetical protein ABEJ91_01595 [Candidatus Nanohaloarchaea archaeon]
MRGSPVGDRTHDAKVANDIYGKHVNANLVDPEYVRESSRGYSGNGERPEDKDPHDERPGYDDWDGGLDDESALDQFAGLFGGDNR